MAQPIGFWWHFSVCICYSRRYVCSALAMCFFKGETEMENNTNGEVFNYGVKSETKTAEHRDCVCVHVSVWVRNEVELCRTYIVHRPAAVFQCALQL